MKACERTTFRTDWNKVFTCPENPTWHLVKSNSDSYGLSHDCLPNALTQVPIGEYKKVGCTYCGEQAPDKIYGLFNLCDWKL